MKLKIKKGDKIKVLRGKDRGRTGKVEKVFTRQAKLLVGGLNIVKKHVRPTGEKSPGGIVEVAKPLPVSKVALVCPKCNQPTRVGWRVEGKGEKRRICRKCGQII